jgi:RimJ/RimL family protein N-acetyltransferase
MPILPHELTLRDGELELRRLSSPDRGPVLRACQDAEIARWTGLPSPFTVADVDALFRDAEQRWEEGTAAELAILDRGAFAGSTHIVFHAGWRASVAYWLAPEARGRGLATRSVRLLTPWAFDTFAELVRIELWSIVGNEASDAVARRAGFVEEGVLRSRLPLRDEYRDVRCFSFVRGDRPMLGDESAERVRRIR